MNLKIDWYSLWWKIQDVCWYNWTNWIRTKYEMISRMVFWGWKMRWSYDFDAHTIYEMLYFKLDRIYNCMRDNGNCVWNSSEDSKLMRRLYEAKWLAKRLSEDQYDIRAFKETEEKYKYHTWFTPLGSHKDLYSYHYRWGDNKEENKKAKIYMKSRDKIYRKMKEDDKNRFYYLLNKYIDYWWD